MRPPGRMTLHTVELELAQQAIRDCEASTQFRMYGRLWIVEHVAIVNMDPTRPHEINFLEVIPL